MPTTQLMLSLAGSVLVLGLALPVQAQTTKGSPQLAKSPQRSVEPPHQKAGVERVPTSKTIDGLTYYYDANGTPLYYDDAVHYNPPKRFHWRNGGWVMDNTRSSHKVARRGGFIRGQAVPSNADGHTETAPKHAETPAEKPGSAGPNTGARKPLPTPVASPADKPAAKPDHVEPPAEKHSKRPSLSATRTQKPAPVTGKHEKPAAPVIARKQQGSSGSPAPKSKPTVAPRTLNRSKAK